MSVGEGQLSAEALGALDLFAQLFVNSRDKDLLIDFDAPIIEAKAAIPIATKVAEPKGAIVRQLRPITKAQ